MRLRTLAFLAFFAPSLALAQEVRSPPGLQSGGAGNVSGMSIAPSGVSNALSLSDLLGVTIDIRQYGASPLNTAIQNSTAIQAAFDAATVTGRDVFVPQGKFDHNGLTWSAASRVRGTGTASQLNYTGTGVGIAIADGASDFTWDHLRVSMAGDGSAFKFTGTNLRYEFANLVVEFPGYAGTAARRGFDYNLASTKYTAFAKFNTMRVFSAGAAIYVDPASSEVNNVDLGNVEFGACIRAVDAKAAVFSGWTIEGGSAEAPSNGENQFSFDNIQGITMLGVRTETKNSGGWDVPVAGVYTTHTPIHFGPNAQKTAVIEPVFFPHTANVYLHEGIRKLYIHAQDGILTDAPVSAGAGTFSAVTGTTGTFSGAMERRGAAGTNRLFNWTTNGSLRMTFGIGNAAEAGSNAGSDFAWNTYTDAGAYLSTPMTITRSTGRVTYFNGLSLSGVVNAASDAAAATAGVPVNGVYRNGSALQIRVN